MRLDIRPRFLVNSKVLAMVQDESGFQARGAAVHDGTGDVYSLLLQLLLEPLSRLIVSHDTQHADFRSECDQIVSEVRGPSEHKFLGDEICNGDRCFSR